MKKLLILFLIFYTHGVFAQEDIEYKEYSYTEFFQMIEDEEDSVFRLKNSFIVYNSATDSAYSYSLDRADTSPYESYYRKDTIVVNKSIELNNVHFKVASGNLMANNTYAYGLYYLKFNKDVTLIDVSLANFYNCLFRGEVNVSFTQAITKASDTFRFKHPSNISNALDFWESEFSNRVDFISADSEFKIPVSIQIQSSKFEPKGYHPLSIRHIFNFSNITTFYLSNNDFIGNKRFFLNIGQASDLYIANNRFQSQTVTISLSEQLVSRLAFIENQFNHYFELELGELNQNSLINWDQLKDLAISNSNSRFRGESYENFNQTLEKDENYLNPNEFYAKRWVIENEMAYKSQVGLLGRLRDLYQMQHDMASANAAFVKLKDLETKRLKYLYERVPSFDTYFDLQINRFLRVFSDYGTRPAKAITFSIYVILVFALVYLFFPNHWDSHGRRRMVDRYSFFLNYLDKKAGIHEVYLQEKEQDLLEFAEFKEIIEAKRARVPKLFTSTAYTLYKWAVSGTKLTSRLLKRIDIVEGKWSDLPENKRKWKTLLIGFTFILALLYDLFIKMLNALMLSINTFTTLGFGEIPIKGLPRYLAIIQGFIGWFMLTIFSVSLISQLLN